MFRPPVAGMPPAGVPHAAGGGRPWACLFTTRRTKSATSEQFRGFQRIQLPPDPPLKDHTAPCGQQAPVDSRRSGRACLTTGPTTACPQEAPHRRKHWIAPSCRMVRGRGRGKAHPRPLVGVRLLCPRSAGRSRGVVGAARTDHPLSGLTSSPRVSAARGLVPALPAPVRFLCRGYPVNLSSGHGKPWTCKQVAPGWLHRSGDLGDNRVLGLVLASNARFPRHSGITSHLCPGDNR